MGQEKTSSACLDVVTCEIDMKLPSLNQYINLCKENRYKANAYKQKLEEDIAVFFKGVPKYDGPVTIHFHWIEDNRRRDLDNVCFAKKFILDALVKSGHLKDDNRRYVTGFRDTFAYGKRARVILYIKEETHGKEKTGGEHNA